MFRVVLFALFTIAASTTLADDADRSLAVGVCAAWRHSPTDQATLAIEFSALVRSVHYKEGQSFRKGDRLVEFDCRRQRAEMTATKAAHREMELNLKSNQYLRSHGAVGEHDIEISRARADKAAAEVDALRLRLEQCQINAPFDGSVAELSIHAHEIPAPGKPFMKIIKSGDLEIELIVPSKWLVWLRKGEKFEFSIEETARSYPAAVKRIATAVDPVSQTVKIIGELSAGEGVLSGMSGTAHFQRVGG